MKKYTILSILAILVFSLASCVSTKTTSFSNVDSKDKTFNSICVYADLDDFEAREKLETKLVKELSDMGVKATKSLDVLPPINSWTEEELKNKVNAGSFDAFLKISFTTSELVHQTDKTYDTKDLSDDKSINKDKSHLIRTNPIMHSNFQSQLIDNKNGKLIWVGSTDSKSSGFNNSSNVVLNSLASDIANELKEKGHLK